MISLTLRNLWKKRSKITLENKDGAIDIEKLLIVFTINHTDKAHASTANISIYNLSDENKDFALSADYVRLYLGFGDDHGLAFEGDIVKSTIKSAIQSRTDRVLSFQAGDGQKSIQKTSLRISAPKIDAQKFISGIKKNFSIDSLSEKGLSKAFKGATNAISGNAIQEINKNISGSVGIVDGSLKYFDIDTLKDQSIAYVFDKSFAAITEKSDDVIQIESPLIYSIRAGDLIDASGMYIVKSHAMAGDTRGGAYVSKIEAVRI